MTIADVPTTMASRLGMVQVSQITYRIVKQGDLHHVIRIRDDRHVGTFKAFPIRVLQTKIGSVLEEVAAAALRAGRIEWQRGVPAAPHRTPVLSALVQLVFTSGQVS